MQNSNIFKFYSLLTIVLLVNFTQINSVHFDQVCTSDEQCKNPSEIDKTLSFLQGKCLKGPGQPGFCVYTTEIKK